MTFKYKPVYHRTWLAPQCLPCARDSMKLSPSLPPTEGRDTGCWPAAEDTGLGTSVKEGQRNLPALLTGGMGMGTLRTPCFSFFLYLFSLMHRAEGMGSRGRLVPTSSSSALCLQSMEQQEGSLHSTVFGV